MMTYINLKPKASITQKGKILETFSLRSGIRQGYTLLPLLFKNCLLPLSNKIRNKSI